MICARLMQLNLYWVKVQNLAVEDEGTVTDIDTVQDLARAERLLASRPPA